VAVCLSRAVTIEPVGLNQPVLGSYSSAEARGLDTSNPPAIRTRPSGSSVAVWTSREVFIEPVGLKPGVGVGETVAVGVGVGVSVGVAVAGVQAARLAPINRTVISRPTLA